MHMHMHIPSLPRTVWMLGLVSLFMDMSSEFIHAVLPVYLTATLGMSVLAVGVVEGIAEAAASIMKVFSGVVSDHFRQRKALVLAGMLSLAISQLVLAMAATTGWLFWVGIMLWGLHMGLTQGLLSAGVAQLAPSGLRGTAFGLFHLMTGMMQLLAGAGFGWLWVVYSPDTAFAVAAGLSFASMVLVLGNRGGKLALS